MSDATSSTMLVTHHRYFIAQYSTFGTSGTMLPLYTQIKLFF